MSDPAVSLEYLRTCRYMDVKVTNERYRQLQVLESAVTKVHMELRRESQFLTHDAVRRETMTRTELLKRLSSLQDRLGELALRLPVEVAETADGVSDEYDELTAALQAVVPQYFWYRGKVETAVERMHEAEEKLADIEATLKERGITL